MGCDDDTNLTVIANDIGGWQARPGLTRRPGDVRTPLARLRHASQPKNIHPDGDSGYKNGLLLI
jgi:hypothetical protein